MPRATSTTTRLALVALMVLGIAAVTSLVATASPPTATPASPPAHNRDAKLLLTYSRTAGFTRPTPASETPGLVFALWDDGWAIARAKLRADRGPFVAMRFSKEAVERMKTAIACSGVETCTGEGLSMAPDEPFATLRVRTAQGVRGFNWSEGLSTAPATPDARASRAMWVACTSQVVSELPEEVLDEETALKGKVFRGFDPHRTGTWWPQ